MKYYHIEVNIKTNNKSPYFVGSMIRGAFGYGLKKVTCINPSFNCEGCFAQSSCLFYEFYEAKNILHKYRFDIKLGSNNFDFGLYIFDNSCDKLPYILSALEMTLKKIGMGKDNLKFDNIEIFLNQQSIYEKNKFLPFDISPKKIEIENSNPNIKIKLLTPLRIKKNNKLVKDSIEIEDILRSIYQREQEIFYDKKVFRLEYKPTYVTKISTINHKTLIRKSNRQKVKMNMDGIMGEIAIIGIDKESYRLLKIGEIIGVGKQCVFGLGKIEIVDIRD